MSTPLCTIPAEGMADVPYTVEAIVEIVLQTYPTAAEIFFGTTDDYDNGRFFEDSPRLRLADGSYVNYSAPAGLNGTSCWTAELTDDFGPRLGKYDSLLIVVGPPTVVHDASDGLTTWERFGYRP